MKRGVLALVLAGVIGGCGPEFRNEYEERAYLESLANPTPAQWNRKNELIKKRDVKFAEWAQGENARIMREEAKAKTQEPTEPR